MRARKETVSVFADEGVVRVHTGATNNNFNVSYSAVISIYDTPATEVEISYVLSLWIKESCKDHNPGDLKFFSQRISDSLIDVTFSLPISETIKAQDIEGKIKLLASNSALANTPSPYPSTIVVEHDDSGQ